MLRRTFLGLLGGAAMFAPHPVRAQQRAMPVVGCLSPASPDLNASRVHAFRQGLKESGYIEGTNVAIEYRWADNQYDRRPMLAADLVDRRAAVIFVRGLPAVRAAIAATAAIPIVFSVGEDPVQEGFVQSFNRPGGNVTGFSDLNNQLAGKRLGLMLDVFPRATTFGLLVNPDQPNAEPDTKDMQAAADARGHRLRVLTARTERDIETAFASMNQLGVAALFVNIDFFFLQQREKIVALAARHAMPTVYSQREFVAAGGLMSYGTDTAEGFRQSGIYVGRILKGAKPAELPVQRATKFEMIINLKTAKALGLELHPQLLSTADEAIE